MSIATLRPDGTIGNSATLTGGATAHAVLSDDSDASYAQYPNVNYVSQLNLDTFSLPAGAVAKGVRFRARQNHYTTPLVWRFQLYDPTRLNTAGTGYLVYLSGPLQSLSSVATVPTVTAHYPFTQAEIDGLAVAIDRDGGPGGGNVYEVFVDLIYVEQPVVTVTTPTGTVTNTNRPAVTWTNTLDSDGGAQTHYEVKIFSAAQYGASGFDAATSVTTDGSGVVASSAGTRQVAVALPDGTYRAYVRVAQLVHGVQHWSDWDYEAFTIDVVLPAVPTLTLTPNDAGGRVLATLFANAGDATTDALELQRATPDLALNVVAKPVFRDGVILPWGQNNVTGSAVVRGGRAHQTCPGTNAAEGLFSDSPAGPGAYQPSVEIALINGTAQLYVYVGALDASGSELAEAWGDPFTPTLLAQRYSAPAITAPAGTVALRVVVANQTADPIQFFLNAASSQVDYFDGDSPGVSWLGAELASPSQRGEWLPVRHSDGYDVPVPDDFAVVYDYECPNGQDVRYRLRALHDYSGLYASSEWVEGTVMWESAQWWVKHPIRPTLNLPVVVSSYREVNRAVRQTAFQPMGSILPVVVSDTRGGPTGTVVLLAFDTDEQDALDALLDTTDTLLLQGPVEDGHPDRYVRFGDHGSSRVVDKSFSHITHESLPWWEVAVPGGAQIGDQYAAPVEDDDEELVIV